MTITHGYCALDELKQDLGNIADTADDVPLERAISAASRQIDAYCGRRFWQDDVVQPQFFHAFSHTRCEVEDISTATGLVVAVDLLGYGAYDLSLTLNSDFITEPINAASRVPVWPYEELRIVPFAQNYFPMTQRPGVKVTAKFGWPAVPDDVTQACLLQAAQLFKAKDAVFGVASFGDLGALRVKSSMHEIAMGLLSPYRKPALG